MAKMTKQEVQAWKAGLEAANARERQELRSTPVEIKLKQLATLMQWVRDFGWDEALRAEEAQVRERWIRLKKFYCA